MKPAVLALVAVLLLDFAVVFALVVLQLEPDGSPEETLVDRKVSQETPNCRVTLEEKCTLGPKNQIRAASPQPSSTL